MELAQFNRHLIKCFIAVDTGEENQGKMTSGSIQFFVYMTVLIVLL